jgi:hypothetical protein
MIALTQALTETIHSGYVLDGRLGVENFGKEIKYDESSGNIGEDTDPTTEDNDFTPGQSSIFKFTGK